MKRSIRQVLRWTLVVTLATFVGISPASAGWLIKRMRGCELAPTCSEPDPCCESAPVCCEAPTCCTPTPEPTCCPSAPLAEMSSAMGCCGDSVMQSAPYSEGFPVESSVTGDSVIQGDVIYSEPAPMVDSGTGMESGMGMESGRATPPPIEDIEDVESPKLDSDAGKKTSSAKPPADEKLGDSVMDTDSEPSPFAAPPEPKKSPEPKKTEPKKPKQKKAVDKPKAEPKVDPTPEPPKDDLFGDGSPEPEPKSDTVDDLFGDPPANEPAMPADPAPADAGLDDLFGGDSPAAEPAMPADLAPADTGLDDLFGGDSPAAEPAMPADPAPGDAGLDDLFGGSSDAPVADAPAADTGLDDLFGEPPAMDAPGTPGTPADGGIDDLFGDPPANDKGTLDSDLDDLFGQTDQPELIETPEAAMKVVSETVSKPVNVLENTEVRTWVDNTGLYKTVGRLIKINEDHVKLLKSNGKTCTVPMSRLSQSDSDYVSSLASQNEVFVVAMSGE